MQTGMTLLIHNIAYVIIVGKYVKGL